VEKVQSPTKIREIDHLKDGMIMWSKLAIRHKLSIVIGGALLLSLIISTFISNSAMRDMVLHRIQIQEIPSTLDAVANAIEKEINIPLAISKAMSLNHFSNKWLANGEPVGMVPDITEYLRVMRDNNKAITSFIVSNNSKNYYTPDGISRQVSPEEDAWFYDFMRSGKNQSLDLDIDIKLKKLALFINFRTNNDQAITGIGMGIDQVLELINNYQVGEKGLVYITDNQGNIVIHPDSSVVSGTSINDYLNDLVGEKLLNENETQVLETHGNKDAIIAAKFVSALNWFIVVEIPTEEIYGPINSSSIKLVGLNFIVAILLIILGLSVAMGVAKPVTKAAQMLNTIASGDADLSKEMDVLTQDEVGELARSFNHFISQLRVLIKSVAGNAILVNEATLELSTAAASTEKNTENQQQSVDMVATAINEMGATVQEIARNASDTAESAKHAAVESQEGQEVVNKTIAGINSVYEKIHSASEVIQSLANDVGQISTVLEVIRGISEQTNLLALNAAIEAARAGEQGRGFAVVADEVRTLAHRTQESTQEINLMIEKLQGGAQDAVSAMNSGIETATDSVESADTAGQSLVKITEAINSISDLSTQVATATEQQSSVVEELNSHILNIKDMSDDTATQTKTISDKCLGLTSTSNKLTALVGNFKL